MPEKFAHKIAKKGRFATSPSGVNLITIIIFLIGDSVGVCRNVSCHFFSHYKIAAEICSQLL